MPTPHLRTGHVGLNVTDLDRSTAFYQRVFGFQVIHTAEPDRYRFLGDGSTLILTLWRQSGGAFTPTLPGLHHLSFQVDDADDVRQAERTLRDLGAPVHHGGVVRHAEGAASAALFFEDPDGIRLEIFSATGGEHHPSPYGDAPACGFF